MNPNNRFFAWLSVVSAVVGIVGFLMQVGAAPVLAPLVFVVPMPVWLVLAALLLLPAIFSLSVQHATQNDQQAVKACELATRHLQDRCAELEAKVATIPNLVQDAQIGLTAAAKLQEYEALEQEVVGALMNGAALGMMELQMRTSAGQTNLGEQKLNRALASLGTRIAPSKGKYALIRPADASPCAPADGFSAR